MNRRKQTGRAEYDAAVEFMHSAHELIQAKHPTPGTAARSLINLIFLALEIALKCHLKIWIGSFPKTHELSRLYDELRGHSLGKKHIEQIALSYAHFMQIAKTQDYMKEHNWNFNTLEKLFEELTKKTFLDWRYFFEDVHDEVLSGKRKFVRFPFFNVYLVTWILLTEADKLLMVGNLPVVLSYEKMPYWFCVRIKKGSSSEIEWQTGVSQLLLGRAQSLASSPPIYK